MGDRKSSGEPRSGAGSTGREGSFDKEDVRTSASTSGPDSLDVPECDTRVEAALLSGTDTETVQLGCVTLAVEGRATR